MKFGVCKVFSHVCVCVCVCPQGVIPVTIAHDALGIIAQGSGPSCTGP